MSSAPRMAPAQSALADVVNRISLRVQNIHSERSLALASEMVSDELQEELESSPLDCTLRELWRAKGAEILAYLWRHNRVHTQRDVIAHVAQEENDPTLQVIADTGSTQETPSYVERRPVGEVIKGATDPNPCNEPFAVGGRWMVYGDMTRADVMYLRNYYRTQATAYDKRRQYHDEVLRRLTDDSTTVRQVFSDVELRELKYRLGIKS